MTECPHKTLTSGCGNMLQHAAKFARPADLEKMRWSGGSGPGTRISGRRKAPVLAVLRKNNLRESRAYSPKYEAICAVVRFNALPELVGFLIH
jgi:hypothetical protein